MHIRKMTAGTEMEHACSVSHCVLHLFLNSKQRTKLETVNSDGIYFRSSDTAWLPLQNLTELHKAPRVETT